MYALSDRTQREFARFARTTDGTTGSIGLKGAWSRPPTDNNTVVSCQVMFHGDAVKAAAPHQIGDRLTLIPPALEGEEATG